MVFYLQSANESNRILEILEEVNIRGEMVEILIKAKDFSSPEDEELMQLLSELDLKDQEKLKNLIISVQVIYLYEEKYYIFLEPDFHFNKYRLITLRSSLYDEKTLSFDLQKVRNFCRTKEREAAKSGFQKEIWSNSVAENIFGKAEDSGDFTGNGSSGWKLNALANYLFDFYALRKNLNLVRLTYYDVLMVQGNLTTIGKHLKLKNKDFDKPIQRYLARKIGLNLPQD
jgi:hypothetical protein